MDRRQRVGVLSEENKKLNRKLDRSNSHKEEIKKLKKDLIASKAEIKLTKKVLIDTTDLQAKSNIIKGCFLIKKKECLKLKESIKGLEINLKALSEGKGKESFLEKMNRLETENQDLKKMSNELETSKHYLEQILEDGHDNTLYLYDEREREYNNEAVKCIMNLTDSE